MSRIPMIDGDEFDALTRGGRQVLAFRPGERDKIKRKFRRRERQVAEREMIREAMILEADREMIQQVRDQS